MLQDSSKIFDSCDCGGKGLNLKSRLPTTSRLNSTIRPITRVCYHQIATDSEDDVIRKLVETPFTANNSPIQDNIHPDDTYCFISNYDMTSGFKELNVRTLSFILSWGYPKHLGVESTKRLVAAWLWWLPTDVFPAFFFLPKKTCKSAWLKPGPPWIKWTQSENPLFQTTSNGTFFVPLLNQF